MTDQGKINREGARPASLFERADATFGLGPVRTPPVPPVPPVPEALRRAPAPQPVSEAPVAPQPVAFAKPEPAAAPAAPQPEAPRAVAFGGPLVHIDRDHLRDGGLIVPEDPVTGLLE